MTPGDPVRVLAAGGRGGPAFGRRGGRPGGMSMSLVPPLKGSSPAGFDRPCRRRTGHREMGPAPPGPTAGGSRSAPAMTPGPLVYSRGSGCAAPAPPRSWSPGAGLLRPKKICRSRGAGRAPGPAPGRPGQQARRNAGVSSRPLRLAPGLGQYSNRRRPSPSRVQGLTTKSGCCRSGRGGWAARLQGPLSTSPAKGVGVISCSRPSPDRGGRRRPARAGFVVEPAGARSPARSRGPPADEAVGPLHERPARGRPSGSEGSSSSACRDRGRCG